MTWQEAVDALVAAGWSKAEAEARVDLEITQPPGTITGLPAPYSGIVPEPGQPPDRTGTFDPQAILNITEAGPQGPTPNRQAITEAQARAGVEPFTSGPRAPRPDPVGEQTDLEEALRIANHPNASVRATLTPEAEQLIEDASQEELISADAAIGALADEERLNYDWVHQLVDVGALDDNQALIELYEALVKHDQAEDGLTDDEEIVTLVKTILSRGSQNEDVKNAIRNWGDRTGVYTSTKETDGVLNTDISAMMVRFDWDEVDATAVGRVALQFDLPMRDLAAIWDTFDAKRGEESNLEAGLEDFEKASLPIRRSITGVARLYKEGLGRFDQSHLLASIYVTDPALAERLRSDPYSLDTGDLKKALDLAGGVEANPNDAQVNWISLRLSGGLRAAAEVDKESMRNAVQVLADGWNLTGTEGIVANLTSELVAQAVASAQASLPNPFGPLAQGVAITDTIQDQAAHVKRRLRASPEYQELFGELAGGESEEEFVRRFERRSQEILGDDVVGAVRNAMRTGNVNTIFQQGLNTPVGESSTRFQEILARNAQVFRDML